MGTGQLSDKNLECLVASLQIKASMSPSFLFILASMGASVPHARPLLAPGYSSRPLRYPFQVCPCPLVDLEAIAICAII